MEQEKMTTEEIEQLREQQRNMLCYDLCKALKLLQPKRLQCCVHPYQNLMFFSNTRRELVETVFNTLDCPDTIFSFYVDKDVIEMTYGDIHSSSGDTILPVGSAKVHRTEKGIITLCKIIHNIVPQMQDLIKNKKIKPILLETKYKKISKTK